MANQYLHGSYGKRVKSEESIINSSSVPCYIGTAPVFRVSNYSSANKPILIKSANDAATKLGYKDSDDFEKYTLSAAVYCHFENSRGAVGPIIVINALDPATNFESVAEKTINAINGIATLEDEIIIDSFSIEGKEKDVDYKLKYSADGSLKIYFEDGETQEVNASYKKIGSEITIDDIIGDYQESTGISTGIHAVSDIYMDLNLIPSILLAPYFDINEKVYNALLSFTIGLNSQYETILFSSIDDNTYDTKDKAIDFKQKTINDEACKLFWGKNKINGQLVPGSISAAVEKLRVDAENNGFPKETCSNKKIDSKGIFINGKPFRMTKEIANELNENGITTFLFQKKSYVVWGPHMANYQFGVTDSPDEICDTNIMANKYINNQFIEDFSDEIDKARTRTDIDSLRQKAQEKLDKMVALGYLLYAKVDFVESDNPLNDIINGDFVLKTLVTNTPIAKSITNTIQYTSEGLSSLFENNEKEGEE